jgi:hypothetical protein
MSVLDIAIAIYDVCIEYWDWYLLIGVMLSYVWLGWDRRAERETTRTYFLIELNKGPFAIKDVGWGVRFVLNAFIWPLEFTYRFLRSVRETR